MIRPNATLSLSGSRTWLMADIEVRREAQLLRRDERKVAAQRVEVRKIVVVDAVFLVLCAGHEEGVAVPTTTG